MCRTSRAIGGCSTGRPATGPATLNRVTGFNSPSVANTVYARASCTRLTEMPWPYAIVACSIGRQLFAGRSRPDTSPGKPVFGGAPNPALESVAHIVSGGSESAIFAAPTFDDFCTTSDGLFPLLVVGAAEET